MCAYIHSGTRNSHRSTFEIPFLHNKWFSQFSLLNLTLKFLPFRIFIRSVCPYSLFLQLCLANVPQSFRWHFYFNIAKVFWLFKNDEGPESPLLLSSHCFLHWLGFFSTVFFFNPKPKDWDCLGELKMPHVKWLFCCFDQKYWSIKPF